jgi:nucleotide-binding universal stress UspA family protein
MEHAMKVNFDRILCTTDLSDLSNRSISAGVALAKEFNAKLYVCHVVDLTMQAAYGDVVLAPLELQSQTTDYALHHISDFIGEQDIDWEALIVIGHPSDEIARLVSEYRIDLTVAATHGRSGLKRFVLGSVTERLTRTLSCPLLVVKSRENDPASIEKLGLKINKILVGCDFSPYSELAFQYGLSLAQEFEAEVHMVHVVEAPIYKGMMQFSPQEKENESFENKLHARIKEKLSSMIPEDSKAWCEPKIILLEGHPHEELIKHADENQIDLIVLGIRGRTLIEALFTGSTTDRALRQSNCPVLSVCPIAGE